VPPVGAGQPGVVIPDPVPVVVPGVCGGMAAAVFWVPPRLHGHSGAEGGWAARGDLPA